MKEATLQKKQEVVQEIKTAFENAKSTVIVEYRGLTVKDLTELRNQYRANGVNYKVYKNTLVSIALKELGYEGFEEYTKGPNGFAFSNEDLAKAAKVSTDFAKNNDKLIVKAALMDGEVLDEDQVKAIAKLPSKEVLIAKVLGGFNAPITGFVNVLQGSIRNLVYALNAIKEKEEQEA